MKFIHLLLVLFSNLHSDFSLNEFIQKYRIRTLMKVRDMKSKIDFCQMDGYVFLFGYMKKSEKERVYRILLGILGQEKKIYNFSNEYDSLDNILNDIEISTKNSKRAIDILKKYFPKSQYSFFYFNKTLFLLSRSKNKVDRIKDYKMLKYMVNYLNFDVNSIVIRFVC